MVSYLKLRVGKTNKFPRIIPKIKKKEISKTNEKNNEISEKIIYF